MEVQLGKRWAAVIDKVATHQKWPLIKRGFTVEDTTEKQQEEEEELPSEDIDPADVATFIPVVARKMTEKETIMKSVHHRQPTEDQIVPWPENGSVPIDEFNTKGYNYFQCFSNW